MANRGFAAIVECATVKLGLRYHLQHAVKRRFLDLIWKVEMNDEGAAVITINCPKGHATEPDVLKE